MTKTHRPPLNSAEFNIREIVKQLLLLEEHLTDDEKYCEDCIRKHLLHTEALAEEALTLQPLGSLKKDCNKIASLCRQWMCFFIDGIDKHILSQKIRTIRKSLMNKNFDPRA